jgi:hypothetical protein
MRCFLQAKMQMLICPRDSSGLAASLIALFSANDQSVLVG